MTLERYLVNQGHVHHFMVQHSTTGWDVREEEDSTIIRQAHYDDWHRVERSVQLFEQAATMLERDGWIEQQGSN